MVSSQRRGLPRSRIHFTVRCCRASLFPLAFRLLPLALVFSRAPLYADEQPVPRVTLAEALERLTTQTPDALAARLQVAQAEAERLAVMLYRNPTLSIDADDFAIGRTNPPGLSVGQTVGSTVRLDQPLVLWGKRRLRIEGAEAGVGAAKYEERDILHQLRSAVKDAFFRATHDERLLAFARENQERYQKTVALSERRFRSGDIAEAELRKIELEQLKYLTGAEEARRALLESEQLLGRVTGAAYPVAPSGALTVPDAELAGTDALQLAIDNRPDLAAFAQARQQAEIALRVARRERYPDITVGVDYTHSQFVISGDNRNALGFGFSLPLPVLNQNQGEIAKAEVALRQADTDVAKARLDIAQEVHDALDRYQSTQRLRRTFESGYLDRARVTLGAAEAAYRSGGASLIELLEAERTYTTTQTDYLDTMFAARSSLTALEKAVGKDLTNP